MKSHTTCDKSVSFIKTLRKRFQLKSNAEPILKIKFNTRPSTSCKNIKISNSSHEFYNDRALCPLPPRLSEASCSTTHEYPIEDVQPNTNGYESCENHKAASLTCQLLNLSKCGWYWGPISREEAELKLTDEPDGAFLVRDSSADRYLLSLSFRSYGRTLHTRIDHSFGLFSFYSYPEHDGFGSIVELIHNSMHFSQSGAFCYSRPRSPGHPSFPVRLTKPISRFSHVRSLQYLCRFVIRQKITVDNIEKLPLPTSIKGYLEEGHY
ncbi:hypothetical protein B566_EDAN016481 [Ephemera danica]|nr:hypothetical protein B566_EDAN016481 [Ephemera danica]